MRKAIGHRKKAINSKTDITKQSIIEASASKMSEKSACFITTHGSVKCVCIFLLISAYICACFFPFFSYTSPSLHWHVVSSFFSLWLSSSEFFFSFVKWNSCDSCLVLSFTVSICHSTDGCIRLQILSHCIRFPYLDLFFFVFVVFSLWLHDKRCSLRWCCFPPSFYPNIVKFFLITN